MRHISLLPLSTTRALYQDNASFVDKYSDVTFLVCYWGARPYTILKAYKCFIRPVLEYGSLITGALRESQVKEMQIFQNKCLRLALGVTYLDRMRTIDLHDLTNVPMIKTRMTTLAVKTFRSLENTQCFKDLVLNHEIVQKRSGSNTILDQLLAAIQADA